MAIKYATFEAFPAMYDDDDAEEAWVFFGRASWCELHIAEVLQFGQPLTEAEFNQRFPRLPPLPRDAFKPR
jgi:hypothetical protein